MTSAGRAPLLVASNRGPLSVVAVEDGDDEIRRGGGGLVSGMQNALGATPDAVWVCAAMNDRERALARQASSGRLSDVPFAAQALNGDFDVRMLPIDGLTFRNAYNGVANSTLWFVLHMLYELPKAPSFDAAWRRQWASYVRYNQAFAQALAEEAAPNARVMIQDYHLFLAPRMLRTMRPDVRIGHFTHTPWVSPDYFAMLPDDVAYAIVDGLLGADVLGFHTERWAQLFRDTCQAIVGREPGGVAVFPLGTDPDELQELAGRRDVESSLRVLRDAVGDRQVIGRVDRTELSKNVWRGLLAYRELLRTHPEWRGRVVHAVYNNPSREDLPAYREYTASIERLAGRHRRRVRHRRLDAAAARDRRRLPGRARGAAPQRRAVRELGARRHEPRRPGGARRVRARAGGCAVPRRRRRRDAGRRCAAGQSLRRVGNGRGAARGAADVAGRTGRAGRPHAGRGRAAAADPVVPGTAGRARLGPKPPRSW